MRVTNPQHEIRNPKYLVRWHDCWRWTVIALSTLILCACNGPLHQPHQGAMPHGAMPGGAMDPAAMAMAGGGQLPVVPPQQPMFVPGMERGMPLPEMVTGPWAPPGLATPWPEDEYLRDGGDRGVGAQVQPDWIVNGLEPEDAIAHYDTLDGRTVVEPSNRVHIYAPRFSAVRLVTSVIEDHQIEGTRGVEQPLHIVRLDQQQLPASSLQQEQLLRAEGTRSLNAYRIRQSDGLVSNALLPWQFQDRFLPFEDLTVIRQGVYQAAEKAQLSQSIEAAVVWTLKQGVQVILDGQRASEAVGDQRVEALFVVDDRRGPDRLRVIKVASTNVAEPGETVDFTIRYDNVGDQLIGNVTLIDNLTNRLEYIEGTAQSSLAGHFLTQHNEAGSLVLRWEITDPLKPGQGGVVRFRCRVR
jgi:uncharacterized repeat protein (TIGR01451 family)